MSEETIFAAALDLPPAGRAAYLAEACGRDATLRRRLEGLLAASDRAGAFMARPAVEAATELVDSNSTPNDATVTRAGPDHAAADDDEVPLGFLAPATRPDSLGRIGHYEVLQVLGRGGFGIVFRAFDDVLQRVVAVKVLAPQMAATSPARKRFLREARSSAQVRHENVVQVYEVGETPLPYIAMEFIPGETLQQRLDRMGPVDPAEVVRVGRQVAEGLAAAHATDLIHRDIKPGNVLLEGGAQQRAKITDFGLARAADDASISHSGIIAGTPMYMAPEQAKGEKLDQRADLFSLGSVLYQMAAGRAPFRANGTVAVLKRVAEDTPRDIREVIPETPPWLCDIIAKLHAKNPDDRFQTAREVADVLADCEAQLKAGSKLKDFRRIPRGKARPSGRRKWVAAAAVLLVPVVALAVTEFAGVTHLFRGQPATHDPMSASGDRTPVPAAKQEPRPPAFTNTIGMEFVRVPKGKSWLGGGKDKVGEKEVEIPADFFLGKYEVTQEEWEKVMGENPSHFSRNGPGKDAVTDSNDRDLKRFPVESVSWEQCQLFVAKLNELAGETGWVYRLPKEAEWEYACRGGPMADKADSAFDFYFAQPTNTLLRGQANFNRGHNRPCRVGTYEPNVLGLWDMHGNVWEWCDDSERAAGGGSIRAGRGGSWHDHSLECLAVARPMWRPSHREKIIGLRLARVPAAAPSPEAKAPPAVAPFADADVSRIAALPAAEQVEEVRKELMRRNPGFDGTLTPAIENGVVTGLKFSTAVVDDISPVRALKGLTSLVCAGTFPNKGKLSDLAPLTGLPLTSVDLSFSRVQDLGPLQGMPLTSLSLTYSEVRDLTPLTGMKLETLQVQAIPASDLAPLEGMPLASLDLHRVVGVTDLRPLQGMPLVYLNLSHLTLSDLSRLKGLKSLARLTLHDMDHLSDLKPLEGLRLTELDLRRTRVTDLSPLKETGLKEVCLPPVKNITRGVDVLRGMKSLTTIGIDHDKKWPAAEFWERYDRGEFAVAPFADADVKRTAALPAAEQVEEVRKELMRRNPGFDGTVEYTIEDGAVTKLRLVTDRVTDVAPIRVFNALQVLDCGGTATGDKPNGQLADLPLGGTNLVGLKRLNLGNTRVSDAALAHFKDCKNLMSLHLHGTQVGDPGLAHFRDCKTLISLGLSGTQVTDAGLAHLAGCTDLTELNLAGTPVGDAGLAHFKDCKSLKSLYLLGTQVTDAGLVHFEGCKDLTTLNLAGTQVSEAGLAHFKDCKELTRLVIVGTQVADLSPLRGMSLKELECDFRPGSDTEILRSIQTLETINRKPAVEFWKGVEK